ncbi:Fcf2 pre-rRNA processing [Cooperia oncophora]
MNQMASSSWTLEMQTRCHLSLRQAGKTLQRKNQNNPPTTSNPMINSWMKEIQKLLDKAICGPSFEKNYGETAKTMGRRAMKRLRKLEREKTKGRDWFDLPATELTEEAKADLELLQMRAAIDPLAFYLRNDRNVLPKYFQVGRVVDAPQDFYSSRMTKKERKRTMLDELLNDQRLTQSKREKMFMVVIALLPKYKRSFNSSSTPRAMNVTIHS